MRKLVLGLLVVGLLVPMVSAQGLAGLARKKDEKKSEGRVITNRDLKGSSLPAESTVTAPISPEVRKEINLLGNADPVIRANALIRLARRGPEAEGALPRLLRLCSDNTMVRVIVSGGQGDVRVASLAIDAIGSLGPASIRPLLSVFNRLGDSDPLRGKVIWQLGNRGDEQVLPFLERLKNHPRWKTLARRAIASIEERAAGGTPTRKE